MKQKIDLDSALRGLAAVTIAAIALLSFTFVVNDAKKTKKVQAAK